VVYSAHEYDSLHISINNSSVFKKEIMQRWLHVSKTSPVFLGEFGSSTDDLFWNLIAETLKNNPTVHWSIWLLDGTNGYKREGVTEGAIEPFGLLDGDWKAYRDHRASYELIIDDVVRCNNGITIGNVFDSKPCTPGEGSLGWREGHYILARGLALIFLFLIIFFIVRRHAIHEK
jgi:hypothetical protein